MNKIKLLLIILCMMCKSAQAFYFEDTTCTVVKTKSDSSPSAISSIKLGRVKSMTSTEAAKFGLWDQETNSTNFIEVEVFIKNGAINRSFYRVVGEVLHQYFPSENGEYKFRRIIPSTDSNIGRFDQVNIQGASLEATLLHTIKCEKNLF